MRWEKLYYVYASALIAVCLLTAFAMGVAKLFDLSSPTPMPGGKSVPLPPRPEHYSLEMRNSDGRSDKRFVSGPCQRLETYEGGKLVGITIYRKDKGTMWSEVRGEKRFEETPLDTSLLELIDSFIEWTEQGEIDVEGWACRRFVGRYVKPPAESGYAILNGPAQAHEESFIDAANGLPVRHITYDGNGQPAMVNERVSFNLDRPDSSLFEIPEGYSLTRH